MFAYGFILLMLKGIFSGIAILLTFIAFVPYIRSILKGDTKPHVFSWIIWGTTTFIVFLAQLADMGGVGAWPIGVSGIVTIYIAFLAYFRKSDSTITKIDWGFFVAAMASVPIWYLTANPLWAVVMLTTIDVLGFGPTIRKAFSHPYDEKLLFYSIFVVRNFFVVIALENYSLTTVLFPVVTALACMMLIVLVEYKRRAIM